jgi:hypothetical protein
MKMCVDGLRKDKIPQAVEQPPRKKIRNRGNRKQRCDEDMNWIKCV